MVGFMNWNKTITIATRFVSGARKRVGKRLSHYCHLQNAPKCSQLLDWKWACLVDWLDLYEGSLLIVGKEVLVISFKPTTLLVDGLHQCDSAFASFLPQWLMGTTCCWFHHRNHKPNSIGFCTIHFDVGVFSSSPSR